MCDEDKVCDEACVLKIVVLQLETTVVWKVGADARPDIALLVVMVILFSTFSRSQHDCGWWPEGGLVLINWRLFIF